MITSFSKTTIETARKEIDEKLAELKSLGLDISLGNIKFTGTSFTAQLSCTVVGGDDIYAAEFKRSHESELLADAPGKYVEFGGEKYLFRGFKPRTRKSRAIIEDTQGKLFRIEFKSIKSRL